jgi:DNA-damage-inducible protein J
MIRARVEPELKERAESTLEELGLSPTAAITLFYRQIVQHRGLPFEVRIPNAVTRQAMRDAETGENLIEAESMDELFAKLDDDQEPSARPKKGRAKGAR